MDAGGPYINAALICEKVLQERDGVLTAVRIIDRMTVAVAATQGTPPDAMPPSIVQFTILIVLKAGVYKGMAPVGLVIHPPSGSAPIGQFNTDIFFEGDDRGVNLVSPLQFQVTEDGLYWIDVNCGNQLLTRIPLRVIYQRLSQGALRWPPT